jgi:hypothetical protein
MDVLNLVAEFQIKDRPCMGRGHMPGPVLVEKVSQHGKRASIGSPPEVSISTDRRLSVKFRPVIGLPFYHEKRQLLVPPEVSRIKDEVLKSGSFTGPDFLV